ncbi:MAG: glycosyltransferase family 92 protein [Chlamydiae bacterium]|nr:glycosyltransferase family 92 protein [Chlamydiota bacterium]
MRCKIRHLVFLGLVLLSVIFFIKSKPKYNVSICAIFRNEARFLKEWIEYHRIIGVDHFYLYNNLSEDNYLDELNPYLQEGIVELFQWPYQGKNQKTWNKIQCSAYTDLIKKKGKETTWLAIIDVDEFILPLEKKNLALFLKDYEEYGGVVINWQLFGTSHVKRIGEKQTVVGSLTKKAPQDFHLNYFVKSIFQPKKMKKIKQPHYCKYKWPYFHVTENKTVFPKRSNPPLISIDKIRINHYTYRDEEFFYTEKQRRFKEWHPDLPPQEINPELNLVEDLTMLSYLPELEKRLFKE